MDTLVDPAEQQQTARRSSSRMKVDAPRQPLPSIEDAEVEWFARTGAFPRSTQAPSESGRAPALPMHHSRLDRDTRPPANGHLGDLHLDSGELEDDDDLAEDVALDSFSPEDGWGAVDEPDTDTLATRPFVRSRIWSSED